MLAVEIVWETKTFPKALVDLKVPATFAQVPVVPVRRSRWTGLLVRLVAPDFKVPERVKGTLVVGVVVEVAMVKVVGFFTVPVNAPGGDVEVRDIPL